MLEQVSQSGQHQVNKRVCDEKAALDLISPVEHKQYRKCPYRKLRHHNEQDKWKRQQHILSIPLVVSIKQDMGDAAWHCRNRLYSKQANKLRIKLNSG